MVKLVRERQGLVKAGERIIELIGEPSGELILGLISSKLSSTICPQLKRIITRYI